MTSVAKRRKRRWLAPEVVQTSTMDCGPAALKCLLEGFHVPVSYGRLREACQTDVDGTSIDTIEGVAHQLGLEAEQVLIPQDHVAIDGRNDLPALAVVRQADTAPHFVVIWRRLGSWVQVMDPAQGRRWVRIADFRRELFRHEVSVDAASWRSWAGSEDFLAPLRARLAELGVNRSSADRLIAEALGDDGWFTIGALDATVRLAQSLCHSGGLGDGAEAAGVVTALFRQTYAAVNDIYALVPRTYWSAFPDTENTDPTVERLRVAGAVLVQIAGLRTSATPRPDEPPLSPELSAALRERLETPIAAVWRLLREDGVVAPLALVAAMGIASGALILEAMLFRGLFDMASQLGPSVQRLWAALALLAFVVIVLMIKLPIVLETLRHGRQLEARLRMALLRKLPRLNDRYFQSRPITDMADRNHNIYSIRNVPGMALEFVQSVFELVLTLVGVALIAPDTGALAVLLVLMAMAIPLTVQPLLNERDLRVRNHAGALHGFYLDALLGLAPVRAHRAERAVSRQHESLRVEWAISLRGWMLTALVNESLQSTVCTAMAGGLLALHFLHAGKVAGSDLLLIYWVLKLPAIGAGLAGLAHRYPSQRNVLLRMMEPLSAPEDLSVTSGSPASAPPPGAASLEIRSGRILAGGHEILRDLDLRVTPGEHIAIVGPSGAGKSSLLGLLLGWHRLSSGDMLVDGRLYGGADVEQLRRTTAWVDPSIQIWNRTLLENLEYAADGGALDRIGEVMAAARLKGVAQNLPHGLQSLLGEGGGMLSGGEGQRVRLGRALFGTGTRLVLLDEPFRGLDREARQALLTEARTWWQGVTLFCVTHDLGETRDFDRVLVIEGGRIVEDGPPAALEGRESRYRDLLNAEAQVLASLWQGRQWRRLSMKDGKLKASGAAR